MTTIIGVKTRAGIILGADTLHQDVIINEKGKEILKDFSESRIDLSEKISKRFFQEVLTLNYEMWGGRCPNNNLVHYLLATRFDKPRLYICWELGLIEETNFYSLGSGSQFAWEFIHDKVGSFKEKGFSLNEGLKLVSGALIYSASKDSETKGLEMKVIYPDKIQKIFLKNQLKK